jgi:hypothetical protein
MMLARCPWHRLYFGGRAKFLGVRQWWPLWRITWTDGMCKLCSAIMRSKLRDLREPIRRNGKDNEC